MSKSNTSDEPLAARIAADLAERIANGSLAPGDPLPSGRDLARELQVSRSAVREALGRLEAQGLVTVSPRRGAYVADGAEPADTSSPPVPFPAVVDLDDVFEVRRLLEPAAVAWAARRADPDALARLRWLAEQFERAVAEGSLERAAEADVSFHLELAAGSGNAVLERLVQQLYDARRFEAGQRLRGTARGEEAAREHARVLAALAARDPDAAAAAMLAHLAAAEAAARVGAPAAPAVD